MRPPCQRQTDASRGGVAVRETNGESRHPQVSAADLNFGFAGHSLGACTNTMEGRGFCEQCSPEQWRPPSATP